MLSSATNRTEWNLMSGGCLDLEKVVLLPFNNDAVVIQNKDYSNLVSFRNWIL